MRHFILFLLSVFCLSANAQWEVVPSGTDSALYSIETTDNMIFIAGASGTLLKSDNQGITFNSLPNIPPTFSFNDITRLDFLNDSVGFSSTSASIFALKTMDGGLTWDSETQAHSLVETPGDDFIFYFKSGVSTRIDSNLFLVEEPDVNVFVDTSQVQYTLDFVDEGELANVGTISWMVRSSDAGETLDLGKAFYAQNYMSTTHAPSSKTIAMVDIVGDLNFSSDSGNTFIFRDGPSLEQGFIPFWSEGVFPPALYFHDDLFGFYGVSGTEHSLYKVNPLSGSFTPMIQLDENTWNSVTMMGDQYVIAVGDSGMLATSFDQGDTWTVENIGTELDLYGVDSDGEGNFIIVGDSGLILTNSAPLVDFIEISSEEDLFEINSENGTLQLSATVFPESAPQNVSWSMVNLSGTATIDQNGLVTAQGNGLVMAVASIPEPPGFTEESETNLSSTSGSFFILISSQSLGEQYLFGSDTTICGADILTVNLPSSVAEVDWSDVSTELSFEISEAGTYWVTVTDGDFIRSDSIQVAQFSYPEFSLGEDVVACSGDEVSLEAPIFGNYEWSTGSEESGILISEAGEYGLGITLNGCTSFDEINVSFLEVPEFDLGEDLSLCEGESTILSAPVEGEYSWSTGSTDAEITVEDEGWIVLEIFDGECSFADSLFLEVKPLPEFSLGADTVICDTASIVLEAFVEGATYQWSDGSESSSIEVAEEGEYSVLVTLNGCSAEDEISVDLINCTLSTSSEISETTFNIFPNPASDLVTLEIPEKLVGASVSVFSSTGKLIDQLNQNSIREELDVSDWPKGIYLIRIEQSGMAVTKELVLN